VVVLESVLGSALVH